MLFGRANFCVTTTTMEDSQGGITTTWAETEGIMAEIKELYSATDDAKTALAACAAVRATEEACAAKQADAKKLIRELTHSVEEARASAAKEDDDAHSRRMEDAAAMTVTMQEKVDALEAQKRSIEDSAVQLREATAAAQEQLNAVTARSRADVPRVKHSISLYANISNIKWDYDAPHLAGHVASGDAVRGFSIDPSRNSDFAIANQLWAIVDGASAGAGVTASPPAPPASVLVP